MSSVDSEEGRGVEGHAGYSRHAGNATVPPAAGIKPGRPSSEFAYPLPIGEERS